MKHLFFKVFHILKLVTWLFPDVQLKETPKSSRRSGLVVLGYNKEGERRGQLHKGMQKENLNSKFVQPAPIAILLIISIHKKVVLCLLQIIL